MQEQDKRRLIKDFTTWDAVASAFRWDIPPVMNIAELCCTSLARSAPDQEAIIHVEEDGTERRWTYSELEEASNALANAFAAQGVGEGDRIAILLPQEPAVIIAHFAAYKLGAVVLPLFTLFGEDALRYRLSDSGAKLLITSDESLPKVAKIRSDLPALETVLTIGDAAGVESVWDEIEKHPKTCTPVETRADTPAVLIYTSGTTGDPKGVLHGHRFLLGHLPAIEVHHDGFPKQGDCGWTPADWAWIGGLMDMAMPCLYYGVPLVSHRMRKFDAAAAYDLMARYRIRNLFMPPTALKMMRGADVPVGVDIRSISSGGESLGADLLQWAEDVLGAPVNEIYGQTECNLVVSASKALGKHMAGAMGGAVPGHEVAIIDAEGNPVPAGEIGEIAVRAPDPVMFLRYWNKPEETERKFVNGWLRTGDLGSCDADGYFRFSSRDDDVITSAGYRIGPSEIENCLCAHPSVAMAACIGIPDALRTEVVKAFIVLREGESADGLEDALIARVKDKVSPHVAPRSVEFIDEMPMTATGKIMRRALRQA
ncbi:MULTISPECIES: AMP-binding protein [Halocynthiibacter]|uniref:AMP-binding protein n=1 Tax=Halocynthiibacter halioticoli TaxID=2986804 RepID=A0AAE3IZT2_9RHOB|nr:MULTISPECIES: AMP-binding protein [Halocynthiibacter]MCV6824719.1 AMP-binding protein [Halocynthiibacter halioticoli]MCW4057720.1 AMP-binding protein [Halocynthiibacter sp. SDUM655004]